jgi:hypothetical protein
MEEAKRCPQKEIEKRSKSSRVSREWYHVNGQRVDGCSGMMNQVLLEVLEDAL